MSSSIPLRLEPRRARADRSADRWVTVAAIALAAAYLVAGALSALLPPDVRIGSWLPIHLALAGASLTAIGGVMPFFTAALAAAPPAPRALRIAVIGLLAGGIGLVVAARVAGALALAALGGALVVVGLAGLVAAAFLPLRASLATRRPLIWAAYLAAIVEVAIGASLATADLGGDRSVALAWPLLKPAHAWLNVLGFVSLVIATTLVHFLPTIAGTRIARRRALDVALVALAAGPALVALGMAIEGSLLVRLGALVEAVGAAALVVGAAGIVRARGRWTTDPGWHRFTLGSLVAALGWFVVGTLGVVAPALASGASAAGWDVRLVVAPLAIGWTAQAIVGSAAHLLPSIGPGDPAAHRALRVALGRWWAARLVALNAGAALAWLGMVAGSDAATGAGIALAAASLVASVALAASTLRVRAPGGGGQSRGQAGA